MISQTIKPNIDIFMQYHFTAIHFHVIWWFIFKEDIGNSPECTKFSQVNVDYHNICKPQYRQYLIDHYIFCDYVY